MNYHEKNLIDDRRKMEAVLNVAWAEFSEGSIVKAGERLLVHWQAAMPLGAEVKWQSFMQESILCLIDRCGGEMESFLRKNYLDNEGLKSQYDHNCLPLWSKFIADVLNIARNLSSDSPKKYTSPKVNASKSSLKAFAGTVVNDNSGDNHGELFSCAGPVASGTSLAPVCRARSERRCSRARIASWQTWQV